MKINIRSMKKAEDEMCRHITSMSQIMYQVDEISRWIKLDSSMEEIVYLLLKWEESFQKQKKEYLQLSMALDSISKLCSRYEKEIAGYEDMPAIQGSQPQRISWNLIRQEDMDNIKKVFGGR